MTVEVKQGALRSHEEDTKGQPPIPCIGTVDDMSVLYQILTSNMYKMNPCIHSSIDASKT